jgi:hypothetical protein
MGLGLRQARRRQQPHRADPQGLIHTPVVGYVTGGALVASGIPEHEPIGQDIRAICRLTAEAE